MAVHIVGNLPQRLTKRLQSPLIGTWCTYADLTQEQVELPELVHELSQLKRSEVIRHIVWLSAASAGANGIQYSVQVELAKGFLDADLQQALLEHWKSGVGQSSVLFHRQQLWFLLQLALFCCRESSSDVPDDELRRSLGRCCLMTNSVLDSMQRQDKRVLPSSTDAEKDEWIISNLLALCELHCSSTASRNIARGQQFWFDLPSDTRIHKKIAGVEDHNSTFKREYGITLQDFFTVTVSAFSFFVANTEKGPPLLDVKQYFPGDRWVKLAEQALSLIARTPDCLAYELMSQSRQAWDLDFSPIRAHPLLEVFPGLYACIDLRLFEQVFTDGIFWLLDAAYGAIDDRGSFRKSFGNLFSAYLHRTINKFTYSGDTLAKTYYSEPKFSGEENEICDGLLHWPNTAVLLEYKGGRLTTRQKYARTQNELLHGIDSLFGLDAGKRKKGIGQLADALARILREQSVHIAGGTPIPLGNIRPSNILPAIVLCDECFTINAVRNHLDRKLRDSLNKRRVDPTLVGPLLVLSLRDIETIDDLATHESVESLFQGYAQHLQNNSEKRLETFQSYAYTTYGDVPSQGQTLVHETTQAVFDQVSKELGKHIG